MCSPQADHVVYEDEVLIWEDLEVGSYLPVSFVSVGRMRKFLFQNPIMDVIFTRYWTASQVSTIRISVM